MDIQYLLALQDLRLALGGAVEAVMLAFAYIGDGPALVALALVLYWCVDKRLGQLAMGALAGGNFVSQFLKNIVCAYRPWVRDPRIVPPEAALEGAGGYSFPSGHTNGATATLGTIAWNVRKRRRWLAALCVAVVLVIAFGRNYLGVHTPQDVIVGFAVGIAAIAGTNAFANWIERSDAMLPGHKRDIAAMAVVLVVCAASLAVVLLKPYPMDYVDGQLLVDPVSMQKGSFEAAGLIAGFVVGWVCERRFVRFTTGPEIALRERVARGVVGVAVVGVAYVASDVLFKALLPYIWAKLCAYFLLVLVAVFVVPALFGAIHRRFGGGQHERDAA